MSEFGNTAVHAPSNSGLQIVTPAAVTMTSSNTFLDIEDVNALTDDKDEEAELSALDKPIEEQLKHYYAFLDN